MANREPSVARLVYSLNLLLNQCISDMDEIEARLIDRIYSAGLIPEEWNKVIDQMSSRSNGRGGSIFILSDGVLSWDAPVDTNRIVREYIAGGWDKNNPRLEALLASSYQGFIRDHDIVGSSYHELPIVSQFLRPNDIFYTAATVVSGARGDLAVFSVDRGQAAGQFTQEDMDWLDKFRPHLARSMALSGRLQMKQASSAMMALNTVGIPAALIGKARHVRATNSLFDQLSGRMFLPSAFGRLSLRDAQANLILSEALSENSMAGGRVRSIPLRDKEGVVGVLHAIPARLHARDVLGDGGTLLVLAQPRDNAVIDPEWLRWLYDLSPAEAQVATLLIKGMNAEEVAVERRTSLSSVRSQIKSLLKKTGLRRQTDFVRSAASILAIDVGSYRNGPTR